MIITLFTLLLTSSILLTTRNANAQTDSMPQRNTQGTGTEMNQINNTDVNNNSDIKNNPAGTNTTNQQMERDSANRNSMHTAPVGTPHNTGVKHEHHTATPSTTRTTVTPAKPATNSPAPVKETKKTTVKSDKSKEKTMYLIPDSAVVKDPK